MAADDERRYASRGGLKLEHALDAFALDIAGLWCADLGCSTGGFTDCLLARGAARIYAIDTAYGELAWPLRNDDRVTVMERTNALHAEIPAEVTDRGGVGLVTVDLSWTPQRLAVPAALRWLGPGGRIVTLIKPHYEVDKAELGPGGVLERDRAHEVAAAVAAEMPSFGGRSLGLVESPVLGGRRGRRKSGAGNAEYLALVERAETEG